MTKCARFLLFLIPAFALAMPAFAAPRDLRLSDSEEPGSVIVFPKFVKGSVLVDGVATPITEIEVSVECPKGVVCPEHQPVKIKFHWVCPGFEDPATKLICKENNFEVTTTVNGKICFGPDGVPIPEAAATPTTPRCNPAATPPAAPCPMGYLIGYVINTSDQPIKFDALIGDGVIRESPTYSGAYDAIPIQADPLWPVGAALLTPPDPLKGIGTLVFDGGSGHYLTVPGTIKADVKYDKTTGAAPLNMTFLTLLTLDVRSEEPNYPTEVIFNFYKADETLLSASFEFICWTEVPLSMIDPNLNQGQMGRKGEVFTPVEAFKFPIFAIFDRAGPVTLLGVVQTLEGPTPATINARGYFTKMFNNSDPKFTVFVPD